MGGIYLASAVIMSTIMLVIMTGIIAVIILGSSSVLVIALMEGYHNITSAKRLKTSFTKYGKKLDSLLENACTMKVRMARIHTTIKCFAAQRDSIIHAIEAKDTTWLQDAMDRFEGVLTTNDGTNRKCIRDMIQDLKAEFDQE